MLGNCWGWLSMSINTREGGGTRPSEAPSYSEELGLNEVRATVWKMVVALDMTYQYHLSLASALSEGNPALWLQRL